VEAPVTQLAVGDIVRVVGNWHNLDSLIGVVACLRTWSASGKEYWAQVDFPMDAKRYYHTSSLVCVGRVECQ
jgi:hypothetical protein